jgi:SAM-dependent methyltransferase
LPYPDASFDVVLSQFGHMFAPRPDVTIAQMRRVLKPGGRIAFATWPPEHLIGRVFAFVGKNSPPPPAGAAPPPQWGNPGIITERLGAGFEAPFFERGTMIVQALSIAHYRMFLETSVGPIQNRAGVDAAVLRLLEESPCGVHPDRLHGLRRRAPAPIDVSAGEVARAQVDRLRKRLDAQVVSQVLGNPALQIAKGIRLGRGLRGKERAVPRLSIASSRQKQERSAAFGKALFFPSVGPTAAPSQATQRR